MLNLTPKTVSRIAPTTVESEEKVELVTYEDSVVSNDYMAVVLTDYYRMLGYDSSWQWLFCTVGGVEMTYRELIHEDTIWQGQVSHPYAIMHYLVNAINDMLNIKPVFAFRPHQIGESKRIWSWMRATGWALLRHMPRTGKTGTALLALEYSDVPLRVLIITTKNAIQGITKGDLGGWLGFIEMGKQVGWFTRHEYVVTTPHQIHKVSGEWDYVIVDESHKIYSDPKPKPSQLWAFAKHVIGDARVMFVTATPHAQSINQLYWQLALCRWSPFGNMSFKQYWSIYGVDKQVVIGNGKAIPVWTEGKVDEVVAVVQSNISSLSQESVGFDRSLLPVDEPCFVELKETTKTMIEEFMSKDVIKVEGVMLVNMNSRDGIIRSHQIEGSTLKYVDVFSITDKDTGIRMRGVKPREYNWILGGMEKVAYIKERWGDVEGLVIMYHYVNEGKLLRREFKNAKVVQGKTHSEGIDLWMYDTMVVYSMDWSVSTYIQRRDRQVSLTNRDKPITVYYLVSKGCVSWDIYQSVVEKGEDLTMKYYS